MVFHVYMFSLPLFEILELGCLWCSIAAIEDLRQCLANTGHHAKLVESFRTALRQRLLTAGAATTDILLQYVSTIKALRTMDPTGVVLEAVAEPIKEYLRGRKDTIRCIVTMLTDDTGVSGSSGLGGAGESLFEELSRGVTALENADSDDDGDGDGDEAWAAAERYVPFSFRLCGDHFFQLICSLPCFSLLANLEWLIQYNTGSPGCCHQLTL